MILIKESFVLKDGTGMLFDKDTGIEIINVTTSSDSLVNKMRSRASDVAPIYYIENTRFIILCRGTFGKGNKSTFPIASDFSSYIQRITESKTPIFLGRCAIIPNSTPTKQSIKQNAEFIEIKK